MILYGENPNECIMNLLKVLELVRKAKLTDMKLTKLVAFLHITSNLKMKLRK